MYRNQTQQLVETMVVMVMMSMGIGVVRPVMLQKAPKVVTYFHGTTEQIAKKAFIEGLKLQEVEESDFPCLYLAANPFHAAEYGNTVLIVSIPRKEKKFLIETLPGYMKSVYEIPADQIRSWGEVVNVTGEPPQEKILSRGRLLDIAGKQTPAHGKKRVLDKKTGIEYSSRLRCGLALASDYYVTASVAAWRTIVKRDPARFELLD